MLIFFVLCAFLQTLWGKPLPPPLGPSFEVTANVAGVKASEQCPAAPDNWCQQLRSVYDIVQSCLFTIFACVWTSIHPNINGPQDSWWTRMKRKVVTTLCAVIAPEMLLLWALNQRFAAKKIADKHNKEFRTSGLGEPEASIWAKFRQLFQPLSKSATRRGVSMRQPWTITHGFFIQMGGFVLYENEYPKEALTYDRLSELLRKEAIDAPTVTENDLQDKSKGDAISKGIVVLQTSWFVLQCIVRTVQHLPLSELEVVTLAFAVLNVAIYVAWWGKPQGVEVAICVPLKNTEIGIDTSQSTPASARAYDQHSNDSQPLMQFNRQHFDEPIDETDTWLQNTLVKDWNKYRAPVFLFIRLPYRLVVWMLRPFGKMATTFKLPSQERPHMPMFYTGYEPDGFSEPPQRIAFIVGTIFGAIHFAGWGLEFPSARDRILWHISAVILTLTPFMFLVSAALDAFQDYIEDHWIADYTFRLLCILTFFYIVTRFVVIAIAFQAILHPPYDVLRDISWTQYIPHF